MSYKIEDYYNLPRGQKIPCKCDGCNIDFLRDRRNLSTCIRSGQTKVFCSKLCSDKASITEQKCQCKNCGKFFFKKLNDTQRSLNHFCSRSCSASSNNKGKTKSSETKEKLRIANQLNKTFKNLKPRKSDPSLKEFKQCPTCKKEFSFYKKFPRIYCCSSCFKNSGKIGGFRENSTIVHRCEYKDQKMDSGAEKIFAIILDEAQIKWEKNSTIFFDYIYENKSKKYYPDFYLPDLKLWVEIKGKRYVEDWLPNKIQSVKDSGLKIILIDSSALKDKTLILNMLRSV